MAIDTTKPNTGQTLPNAIESTRQNLVQLQSDYQVADSQLSQRISTLEGGRSSASPFPQIYTNILYLGGVGKSSWDLAASGVNGLVMSGRVTLQGQDGVTVVHNIGSTNYVVNVTLLEKAEYAGDIWYVRSANSCVIYNTGFPRIEATITIEIDAGMNTPSQWRWQHYGEFQCSGQMILDNLLQSRDIQPDSDNARSIGLSNKRYANIHAAKITLGGVEKTAWPTAVAGSNGNVFQSGSITLQGQDGVTVIHNKGDTNYIVKVMPKSLDALGHVGDLAVVKSANSCVIYNSGIGNISADIEISAIA